MPLPSAATAFVTRAAGFLGTELVRVLVAEGHQVLGLTRSADGAQRVRRAGATPVIGNMLEPGQWQDEAAADWVFHLPLNPLKRLRITSGRAASLGRAQLDMDRHLLDAVAAGATRRIVYLADAFFYGTAGVHPATEDESPRPGTWGRCFTPAMERLEGYALAGLPIVTGFGGWVYGNGSWLRERVIDPMRAGRAVILPGRGHSRVSPIHVHDCARALVHLAERGELGRRYFLVDRQPVRLYEFAETLSRVAGLPLHFRRVPRLAVRLFAGAVMADYLRSDAVFSNVRLRGTGFDYRYPTIEQGLRQVCGELDAR